MIQLQALNKLLSTGDASLLLVNDINDEFFSDYKDEFKYIKAHLDQYGNIPDQATFLSKFPDFDIIDVSESYDYIVEELYADRNKRFLAKTFNKVRDLLNQNKVEEAMQVYAGSSDQAVKATHLNCVDILRDKSRYDAYVERCNDFNKYYVRTGFKELDDIIGGWDRQEELATIAARTNKGKTWLALKCAVAAVEQGLKVGLYSGEMSERKVGYRIDTLISNIPNGSLTKGNPDIQNQYKLYIDNLGNRYKGCFKVLTPAMLGGPAGVTALRAFIEKEDLDILFIDQHSLLEDDRHAKSPVEKASNISRDLKNLQVLKKIPIIAVSQQNRSSTENGINTEHIAQSDRIAQDSTIIIFVEQEDGIMTLDLVKSRDSVNMKALKYAIDLNRGIFNFIPEAEEGNSVSAAEAESLRNEFEDNGETPF